MTRIHIIAGTLAVLLALAAGTLYLRSSSADIKPAAAQPRAMPVPVATLEESEVLLWDEFSGRLDASPELSDLLESSSQVRSAQYQATVALVRALGGGWN